jgi:hypothetical protein
MDNAIFMVRGGLMNEKKEKMVQTCIFMLFLYIVTRVKSQKELSKYLTYVLKDTLLYYDFGSIHSWGKKKEEKELHDFLKVTFYK